MRRLWTEPVVDYAGKWIKFETMRMDPKPIPEAARADYRGRLCRCSPPSRQVQSRCGDGMVLIRDAAGTRREMLNRASMRLSPKAGRKRGNDFEIILTPPLAMPFDAMREYADITGVDRLVVNLGSQRPEMVDARMAEIETLVKAVS